MNRFYIYFHINPLKNEIFYVGKGTSGRAKRKHNRSELWNNIVNKYGYIIDIVEDGLTNEEAFEREIFYIKKIGRRDLGLGTLVNMTDGGDGVTAKYKTEEERLLAKREQQKRYSDKTKGMRKEYRKNYYKNLPDWKKEDNKRKLRESRNKNK